MVLAVSVHVLCIYLLIGFGFAHLTSATPTLVPIDVSLIVLTRQPPLSRPSRLRRPKLAMLQVSLNQPIPEFRVPAPPAPALSAGPLAHNTGSPARRGQIGVGGPEGLRIVHYVVPRPPLIWDRCDVSGRIIMAVRLDGHWGVGDVKILRSTGSAVLDRSAVWAVRRWKFAPLQGVPPGKPIWVEVPIQFSPPVRVLGVPIVIIPYQALPQNLNGNVLTGRQGSWRAPSASDSVRRLLRKLIIEFGSVADQFRGLDRQCLGDAAAAKLAGLGSLRSYEFLGFVKRGVSIEGSESSARAHWEAYEVVQTHGSSIWLVFATVDGAIQQVAVAIR